MFILFILSTSAYGQAAWINEFHYDNAGTDSLEFVEIVSCGQIDSLTVYLYNGATGAAYDSVLLDTVAFATHMNYRIYAWYPSFIQNGPSDGICLTSRTSIMETLAYEGSFTATNGIAAGAAFPEVSPGEGSETSIQQSIQRDGRGSRPAHFRWILGNQASPESVNTNQVLTDQPVIYLSGSDTLVFDKTPLGYQSAARDVVLRGANLTAGVTLYPPEGFEIDTSMYFQTKVVFGSSMTIPVKSDYITPTPLYIRFVPARADGNEVISTLTLEQPETAPLSLFLKAEEGFYAYPRMWINEFHYDDQSYDTLEFVEVAIQHADRYDPSDISLQLYDGLTGRVYRSFDLPDAWESPYEDAAWSLYVFDTPQAQNGPDGLALCYRDSCAQFISYEGPVHATSGPAYGLSSNEIPEMEFPDTPEGSSIQLFGTGKYPEDFTWAYVPGGQTRGWPNGEQVLPVQLVNYQAITSDSVITLQWRMTDELNLAGYRISITSDGNRYDSIGWLNAANKSVYTYRFSYTKDFTHYARVTAEKFNGNETTLFTLLIKVQREASWKITENGNLHAPVKTGRVSIALVNHRGQMLGIYTDKIENYRLALKPWLNSFPQGIYYLRIRTAMEIFSLRFQKPR